MKTIEGGSASFIAPISSTVSIRGCVAGVRCSEDGRGS